MNRRKRIMLYLLSAVVIWAVIVVFVQRSVLFPRYLVAVPSQPDLPAGAELIQIESPAGPVEGWFMPGRGAGAERPAPLVIFAHGNGELIDHWSDELAGYRRLGVSVLLAEYRGYGRSAGSPSQKAIVADYTAFYDAVVGRPEVDSGRIIYHGRSLGGGVLAQLALRRKPAAMILQSTFTSVAAMARRYLVPRFMIWDPFDVLPVVASFNGPVLVIHGDQDQIAPPSHARKIHATAQDSRLIFYPMGHNSPPPADPYWRDIEAFLTESGMLTAQP